MTNSITKNTAETAKEETQIKSNWRDAIPSPLKKLMVAATIAGVIDEGCTASGKALREQRHQVTCHQPHLR